MYIVCTLASTRALALWTLCRLWINYKHSAQAEGRDHLVQAWVDGHTNDPTSVTCVHSCNESPHCTLWPQQPTPRPAVAHDLSQRLKEYAVYSSHTIEMWDCNNTSQPAATVKLGQSQYNAFAQAGFLYHVCNDAIVVVDYQSGEPILKFKCQEPHDIDLEAIVFGNETVVTLFLLSKWNTAHQTRILRWWDVGCVWCIESISLIPINHTLGARKE
ncbi:hypothetical protein Pelo_11381 [Pelomyxa schiedti]|nr:hypothetical protein Pelo_11381 [Pelomyxa schiedti]